MTLLDSWQNLSSPAVPPCLVTEDRVPCTRQGRYWMTLRHESFTASIGACTEHVAAARAASGTDTATFVVVQVTNRHPYWEDLDLSQRETGATDGG